MAISAVRPGPRFEVGSVRGGVPPQTEPKSGPSKFEMAGTARGGVAILWIDPETIVYPRIAIEVAPTTLDPTRVITGPLIMIDSTPRTVYVPPQPAQIIRPQVQNNQPPIPPRNP